MQISFLHTGAIRPIPAKVIRFCLVWIAGLLIGMLLAARFDSSFFSLMRPTLGGRVSIVRQLAAIFLPFLIAAFAAYANKLWLVYLLCLFKSCAFIYCSLAIYSGYGSAGWLVRIFLQFSDIFSLPLFCWFCIKIITGEHSAVNNLLVCIIYAAIIVCIEHFAVLPFTAQLID